MRRESEVYNAGREAEMKMVGTERSRSNSEKSTEMSRRIFFCSPEDKWVRVEWRQLCGGAK